MGVRDRKGKLGRANSGTHSSAVFTFTARNVKTGSRKAVSQRWILPGLSFLFGIRIGLQKSSSAAPSSCGSL